MKTFKCDIELFEWQQDLIAGVLSNYVDTKHIVKSKRQVGKSVTAELLLLHAAVNYRNSVSILVEPSQKQSRKIFKEIYSAIVGTSVFWKANESTLEIQLKNHSVIQLLSGEQSVETLQGFTVRNGGILVIDEAAYISSEVYNALLPMVDANKAPMLIISTPRFRTGWFYDEFVSADGVRSFSYDFSKYDTSALLTADKLEHYRKTLPKQQFTNYYLGEFYDLGGGVFGEFRSCVSNEIEMPHWDDNPSPWSENWNNEVRCVMGIDWSGSCGDGGDDTAIVIFNSKNQMIYADHFNDLNETQTIDHIGEIISQYKPDKVVVETNSIGKVYLGLLRRKINELNLSNVSIKGFNTSNDSKNKIIQKLQVAFQNHDIQILDDPTLISEMTTYQSELTPSGKQTFNAQKGCHDDMVIATALAFNECKKSTYEIL